MSNFKAALFDLDGVVLNTEPQYTLFWKSQFDEFYPGEKGLEHKIKGSTLIQIYDQFFTGELEKCRDLITARLNEFEQNINFEFIPFFERFNAELRSNGVKTAIVTSSNREKMKSVYRQMPFFAGMFDAIFTSDDFTNSKPHPECYLNAAEKLQMAKGDCVVFEDSINGLHAGCNAGMLVVGLATTKSVEEIEGLADCVIENYQNFTFSKCVELLKGR